MQGDGTANETTSSNEVLYVLGRRMERLFLLGVVLIVLSFVEVFLTTASKQLSEDRAQAAVVALTDQLASKQESLTALFQLKPLPTSPGGRTPGDSAERSARVAETRRKLGLPDPPPTRPTAIGPVAGTPKTYAEAINAIIIDIAKTTNSSTQDLAKFNDPSKSPAELLKAVAEQKATNEKTPTAVWGIQTPRLVQVQYAGLDYKVPFGFLSTVFAVALAPLIAGWLSAVYMTRQRELLLIADLMDYKDSFPHVLNFLPVRFTRYEWLTRKGLHARSIAEARINRVGNSLLRSVVVLLFAIPMVYAYCYTLFQLWQINAEQASAPLFVGIFLAFFMALQTLSLVGQEWIALHGKEFSE
jgi:hypothetical protein